MEMITFDLRTTEYKDVSIFPPRNCTYCYVLSDKKRNYVSHYATRDYHVMRVNGAKVEEGCYRERYELAQFVRAMCKRMNVNGVFEEQRKAERNAIERERLESKKRNFENEIARLQSEYEDFLKNEYNPICGE